MWKFGGWEIEEPSQQLTVIRVTSTWIWVLNFKYIFLETASFLSDIPAGQASKAQSVKALVPSLICPGLVEGPVAALCTLQSPTATGRKSHNAGPTPCSLTPPTILGLASTTHLAKGDKVVSTEKLCPGAQVTAVSHMPQVVLAGTSVSP